MRTNMQRALGLCIALCLGLIWACVKVDVSVISQGLHPLPPMKPPISMDDLKKLHTEKSCAPLDVPKELQQTPAWCWAASTRMVMEYHNKQHNKKTDPQCTIAKKILRPSLSVANCCDANPSSQCIQGDWPNRVLDYYQFNYQWIDGPLDDWDALIGEICSKGPFISVIEWSGGGKHAFIVKGYRESRTNARLQQVVEVYDPIQNDPQDYTFDEFVGDSAKKEDGSPEFSHDRTFVQISPETEGQP